MVFLTGPTRRAGHSFSRSLHWLHGIHCRAVIDLVKVGWWPVFNLADVGVTLGAIMALWFIR
jgi:lipoprotein signal peptidase